MNVDYSKKQNWLSLPQPTKNVDTFFLYPSSYVSPKDKIKREFDTCSSHTNLSSPIISTPNGVIFLQILWFC